MKNSAGLNRGVVPSVDEQPRRPSPSRRHVLAGAGSLAVGSLAGCIGGFGSVEDPIDSYEPGATALESNAISWSDLEDLKGELVVYSGRTRDQIKPLFDELEATYPDFSVSVDYDDNDDQLAKIREEVAGGASQADLFYTQDSGALAVLKADGLTRALPSDVSQAVEDPYSDPDGEWTGVSGRVRAVLYNTDAFDGDDLPDDIFAYAEDDRFTGRISTRPNSGSFRAFIIAMMELHGESATREWVRTMVEDQEISEYQGGTAQAEAVAGGHQDIALGNQYYAGRILENDPSAPIDVTFTENDAVCLFNVSGVGILDSADRPNLAAEFLRHVLAAEGQEFFVQTNGEYPVLDGVDYVGDLPTLDEIDPPQFDLNRLGLELNEARQLLREEGLSV